MSTYYKEKIKYITDDLTLENFDLYSALKELKATLGDEDNQFCWKKLSEVKIKLQIITPDYYLLNQLYDQGEFKSHEFQAIADQVKDDVKSAISIMITNLDYTINQYPILKHTISITRTETFQKVIGTKSTRIDNVELIFNLTRLTLQDIVAFLEWWNLDNFAFSKQIRLEVDGKIIGTSEYEKILEFDLTKKSIYDITKFLSTKDIDKTNEFLGHKYFFQILNNYMFPKGFEKHAEITLDVAKDEIIPQKRRTVSLDGSSMKFHQLITEITPFKEYQKIINENRIVGFYCSVKSTNDDLLYFLIDIDVPSLFYGLFPAQTVWELTLNIAKSINKTASKFGFPSFKVSFSGAKGVHLLAELENPKVIQDVEHYVNFPELYSFSLLPGIKTLKKEKVSSLNDSFKFAKSLLQSLLLYTVYKGDIKIPDEIQHKLRISHPYQIFRLSVDSKNRLAILLDCSSMSRGVFRLCSPHPFSKLVSIPISDMKTNKICERYYEYNTVREDAKLESVIHRFENDDVELFLQKPNIITRKHIKELLRPDRLLPAFATLLRFGTIYSIMRSPFSFQFWFRFYELRCYYAYVQYRVEYFEGEDVDTFTNYIENMGVRLKIENRQDVVALTKIFLLHEKISLPLFKHWINTLYHIEFFFNLKSEVFLKDYEDDLIELFQNEMEFNNFLNQAQELFNIAVCTLSKYVILGDETNLSKEQIKSVNRFYTDSCSLIDLARSHLSDLRYDPNSSDKEEVLIKTIHFVIRLYVTSIDFLREFFNLMEKVEGRDIWR